MLCIHYTSAAPPAAISTDSGGVVTKHDNQKEKQPIMHEVEKSKLDTPSPEDPKDSSTKKEEPPSVIKVAPVEAKPIIKPEQSKVLERFPFREIRNNKTLIHRFNKSHLLNEKTVPFLTKCDTIGDKHLVEDSDLCAVYFDNLVLLSNTSFVESINPTDLEAFISKWINSKTFCEEAFAKNVNESWTYFNYSKNIIENFSDGMVSSVFLYSFS